MSQGPGEHAQTPAPPAGEEIHLPSHSVLPVVVAIAITLIVIGTTLSWGFSILGGVIFIVAVTRWIRDTRRDIAALPENHG
jgi:Flp pilus assembly protein TadB